MSEQLKRGLGPFIILTLIYFIVGFLTTVNGQLQGPLKVSFLSEVVGLKNTLTTLISFFFFLGYLVNSTRGGKWINEVGYKSTLLRALYFMVAGLVCYALSSFFAIYLPTMTLSMGADIVPVGFLVFLLGSFFMGTSAAIGQVVINPYIAAYDLPGTQPVQRMNIVCAINSLGTTIAPFFVTGVIFAGVSMSQVKADQLLMPLLIMAAFVVAVTVITSRLYLPNLEETRSEGGETLKRSIWSFRHLRLGVIAIFFYVGAEVSIGVNVNLHAMQLIEEGGALSFFGKDQIVFGGMDFGIPALLATLYWGGLMVGRIVFSMFNQVSPRALLTSSALCAILLTVVAIITNNLWVLISVGLCHSIMWGATFTLAIEGLKQYTSRASGVFMMGVFGGAIFPVLQGVMADKVCGWQWSWLIVILCESVLLYYALWGSRVREEDLTEL